ncbi:MAG TPA: hypothetical protein VIY28_00050 [Pseudonocardiaceae bacterium]
MSTATMTRPAATRFGLVMSDCDCGMCPPTWARRRGRSKRFTEAVTLVGALAEEDPARRAAMVTEHRENLSLLVSAVDEKITTTAWDDPGRPEVGLALVLFAGELASAVRPDEYRTQLPAPLVAACEQTVTAATLAAAACLAGLMDMIQMLAALID